MKQKKIIVIMLSISLTLLGIKLLYWSRMYIILNSYYGYGYTIQTEQNLVEILTHTSPQEQNHGEKLLKNDSKININDAKEAVNIYDESKSIADTIATKTYVSDSNGTARIFEIDHNNDVSTSHSKNIVFEVQVLDINDIKESKDNIFFVETKCATIQTAGKYNKKEGLLLDVRQGCAVESTALSNSDKKVYLLYSCPLGEHIYRNSPEHAKRLFKYSNFHVVGLNVSQVLAGSPVQELYEQNLLEKSSYPLEHTSDVLRYTLLWKFGGTYSDLDVVTIRSFTDLKSNWAGQQDDDLINSGVMNFSPAGEGHAVVAAALARLRRRFDGGVWGANGPSIITDTVLEICNVTSVNEAMQSCQVNFTVLKRDMLYPIYYPSYQVLFDDEVGEKVVEKIKSSAYSVHIWNKLSEGSVVKVGSTQAYALLANEYCPEVYGHSGNEF